MRACQEKQNAVEKAGVGTAFRQNGKNTAVFKRCKISELINVFMWKSIQNSDAPESEYGSRKCVTIHQTVNKHTKQ